MFRLISPSSRAAIRRSHTPHLLNLSKFHRSARLEEEPSKDLYSELLADINDTKIIKRRSRRKVAVSDGLLTPEEIPKVAPKKKPKPTLRKKASKDTEAQDGSKSRSAAKPAKPREVNSNSAKSSIKTEPGVQALEGLKSRKIPLSLLQNPWDNITRYLKSAYSSRKILGDSRRVHVISESLCGMYKNTEKSTSATD